MSKNISEDEIFIISSTIPPDVGGAGVRALRTAEGISEEHNVVLISRTINYNLKIPHITILRTKKNQRFLHNNLIRNFLNITVLPIHVFIKIRKLKKPKIIHCFSPSWLVIYTFFFNKFFWKAPFIIEVTLEGGDTPGSKRKWWLFRWLSDHCLRNANKVNCISPRIYNTMIKTGFPEKQLVKIPNSVDPRFVPAEENTKRELKAQYGFSHETFLITTVGGITKRKGYPLIIDVILTLPNSLNFIVISVGNFNSDYQKGLKDKLISMLGERGMGEKIIFMGYQDPLPFLQMSDLFFFASNREGFGTVLIEAMACGLPVVCRKIEKITEYIITEGKFGTIIDSDNPDPYCSAIKYYIDNREFRIETGKLARMHVQERFSVNEILTRYKNLYLELQ